VLIRRDRQLCESLHMASRHTNVEEYLRIGKYRTIESVRQFAKVIISAFGPKYLGAPNKRTQEIDGNQ
jgi:hypothetical protein